MEKRELLREKISRAFSYTEFKEYSEQIVESAQLSKLIDEEKELFEYRKLNLSRTKRIEKTYSPSDEIKKIITNLDKQIWLVITEDWCGDSAQNLPAISKIASLNNKIELKVVLRDTNLNLMDLYLTDGKRSIPKLIALDNQLNEIFIWGPRPKNAQKYFDHLKQEGLDKQEIIKEIHSWYAKDKCKSLEAEIIKLLLTL
jgi:hypothetical protein